MRFKFVDIVGSYRLVVSPELLTFIERAFVDAAPAHERDRVRGEAVLEAEGAMLEIRADGTFISSSHGQELYRAQLDPNGRELDELSFEKAPGLAVTLRLEGPGALVAHQPHKPPTAFRRVPPQ
jgi:hypothetical protein